MKKDLIFAPILLVIGILLGLLRVTGMTAHIVISVVGVVVLILYTVATKKEWKLPALEILTRVFYAIALISGIVLNINYMATVGVAHKIFAILFVVALIVTLVHKFVVGAKKKNG